MMLLFAVARRCNVFMTSFFAEKIDRAKSLGAKDGVIFTDEEGWPKTLRKLLPKDPPFLDAVIDGAGGDTVGSTWKLLKLGGVVVIYGKTSMGQPSMPMQAVMKNIELKGSTMDSRRDFGEMVRFVSESNIRPVVERVVHGLDNLEGIEGLFENLKEGGHFGKVVVKIDPDGKGDQGRPNL